MLVVRFVVTAAHCVSQGGISLTVTLGKVYIYKLNIYLQPKALKLKLKFYLLVIY